ncbi:hypothetical protein [Sphingobium chungbukense]|nr:hypothetical protein [Sphingobium chungbukense]
MKKVIIAALLAASSGSASASLGSKPGEMVGAWEVETVIDGFSDTKRGITHTKLGADGFLAVKCDKPGLGSLYLTFFTPKYLGSDRISSRVHGAKYRLDDAPAQDLPSPYYDGKAASIIGNKATDLLKGLAISSPKRFRAQFLTYDNDLAEIDVDVTGAANAIYKTAAICEDTAFVQ